MKTKVLDFKVNNEKEVHEKRTPLSFLELVGNIQIYELTVMDWDGWKSKVSFAQAAKSTLKTPQKKEGEGKQSSAKLMQTLITGIQRRSFGTHGKLKIVRNAKKLSDDSSVPFSSKAEKKRHAEVRLEASKVALNTLQAGDATAFFNEFTHYDVLDFC